jgi:hypothetical protein
MGAPDVNEAELIIHEGLYLLYHWRRHCHHANHGDYCEDNANSNPEFPPEIGGIRCVPRALEIPLELEFIRLIRKIDRNDTERRKAGNGRENGFGHVIGNIFPNGRYCACELQLAAIGTETRIVVYFGSAVTAIHKFRIFASFFF